MDEINELVNLYPTPICVHNFNSDVFTQYKGEILRTYSDICTDESNSFVTTDDGSNTNEQKTSIGFNIFQRMDFRELIGEYFVPEILLDYCTSLSIKMPSQLRFSRICKLKKGEKKSFKDLGSVLSLVFAVHCDPEDCIDIINSAFYFQSCKMIPEIINGANAQVISFPLDGKAYMFPSATNYDIAAKNQDLTFVQLGFMYD
tara:strand:- start:2287 stop:2892 length:606 start_codon:yes stop_codon:yes gene_type:complete